MNKYLMMYENEVRNYMSNAKKELIKAIGLTIMGAILVRLGLRSEEVLSVLIGLGASIYGLGSLIYLGVDVYSDIKSITEKYIQRETNEEEEN